MIKRQGWHRGIKKNGPQAIGKSKGGWTTQLHLVAANERTAIGFTLSPGQAHDAPEGQRLLAQLDRLSGRPIPLLMDRAYEGKPMRPSVQHAGFFPVVPPKRNRREP